MPDLRNQYMTALGEDRRRGRRLSDEYEDRARSYDPYESVQTAAEGTWGALLPELQRAVETSRGRTARSGGGRLRSGYAELDENDIWREGTNRIQDVIAQNAVRAASLDLSNTNQIGAYGQAAQGRYLDLLSGERDRELLRENAEENRRASRWGALAGLAGGVAGTAFGPAGAKIGNRLGEYVGSRIGGG